MASSHNALSGADPASQALKRDWTLFTLQTFLFGLGFAVYSGVFQNFLRDVHHAVPMQLGELESIREIPGLLAAITAGTLVALAESRIAGLGLAITGVGIAASGFVPQYSMLVGITVFWSIGFHLYATVSSAITLALAKGQEGGRHLGRMSGVSAGATIIALGLSWVCSRTFPHLSYNYYFVTAGCCIFASAVMCVLLSTNAEGAPRAPIVLRREYGLYYLLIFLEGCRRQIFSIFASFALILVYKVPLGSMLLLQFVNSLMIMVTAPMIGRVVDRVGEKNPLTFYSVGLILVFLGYATNKTVYGLYALFLLDNVLFTFGVGFTTYLHRIVRKGELTPCLAMGTTMNHIAAVSVPVGGAFLWQHFHNYQIPFWVGVCLAVVALIANQWLPQGRGTSSPKHVYPPETPPQEEREPMAI